MGQLAEDVAALEQARQEGLLRGRDLEVIEMQVARAEEKLLKACKASAFGTDVRRALEAA